VKVRIDKTAIDEAFLAEFNSVLVWGKLYSTVYYPELALLVLRQNSVFQTINSILHISNHSRNRRFVSGQNALQIYFCRYLDALFSSRSATV